MKLTIRFVLGLASLFPARAVLADDSNVRVDVVVNMTEEGEKLPHPNPDNPTYYLPCTAGYVELGAVLSGEKPPPHAVDVQRMLGRALADRGYLVINKKHHPSIILAIWWGYMAPITGNPYGDTTNGSATSPSPGSVSMTALGVLGPAGPNPAIGLIQTPGGGKTAGQLDRGMDMPTDAFVAAPNAHQMLTLIAGDDFEGQAGNWDSFGKTDSINEAAHHPRYFLIVSALDFQAATQHKSVLLWCARVSTERAGHTLEGVLPTLIATGVRKFGEEAARPKFATVPAIPMGRVLVGTPVLKDDNP
jgi:hypothetical protein